MSVIDIRTEETPPPKGVRYADSYGSYVNGGVATIFEHYLTLNDGYMSGDQRETCEVKYEDLPNLIKALIKVAEIKGIELNT